MEKPRKFYWIRSKVRMRSEEGAVKFGEKLENMDWHKFFQRYENDTTLMVRMYQELTEDWMDECFPFRWVKKRSNEAPWITHGIRKNIRMRMAIFRREGRSARWKRMKNITDALIKHKKLEYIERVKKEV